MLRRVCVDVQGEAHVSVSDLLRRVRGRVTALVERILVRYWDEERIRRYEHRTFYDLTTQDRGSVTTVSYNLRREEEQIEGL